MEDEDDYAAGDGEGEGAGVTKRNENQRKLRATTSANLKYIVSFMNRLGVNWDISEKKAPKVN